MIKKLSLGTVQFGQAYGIANTTGKVVKEEVFKILDFARDSGICNLDTALAYGDSELMIGEYLKGDSGEFKIVSKSPSLERVKGGEIERNLKASLGRLGVKKIYGYLLHRSSDVLLNDAIWGGLLRVKKEGLVEKIGFSLYAPDELDLLMDRNFTPDIVQVPYSIFDRRFEEYFPILASRNVEIQARSVFLQGLAFLRLKDLPGSLKDARPQLEKLRQISAQQNISIEALCLNFVLLKHQIDKVLVGVDRLDQLKNNIASLGVMDQTSEVYGLLECLKIEEEDVLLPYKWRLN